MSAETMHLLDKKQILSLLAEHRGELEGMGVKKIALFGSYARGSATPESDIDLLVELKEPKYLVLLQLTDYLTELLGQKVDLIRNEPHLKPRFLKAVAKELTYV